MIEMVVSMGIIVILAASVYALCATIINGIAKYRERMAVSTLADEHLEIARNLPYSQLGTKSGNPHGNLPDIANQASRDFGGTVYNIYYVINYFDDSADGTILAGTDAAPNDYKQVKLYIKNAQTGDSYSFLTNVSPKGLENMASGGALSIKVFNAVGQPVPGATVQITNNAISPVINLTRLTDSSGNWLEVGLPNSANNYHIAASKSGYSLDQTYAISAANPSPIKADATISNGQVTQISFSIDKLSSLSFRTLDEGCQPVSNVGLAVRGAKLISTPSVYKFENSYASNAGGQISMNSIEWDDYTPALTGQSLMIYGSSPIQQVNLLPDTSQTFSLILGPKTENSLLVIAKDASTSNAIEGVRIRLSSASTNFSGEGYTGGSVLSQQNWTGEYDSQNISSGIFSGGLMLAQASGNLHASSGYLVSSAFDTKGSETSYTTISWLPASQDPATSIKFQLAANNDNLTWDFAGPDGTSDSYYTVPGTSITGLNGNRYIKYKVLLSTSDESISPVLSSININYISGCSCPGQSFFAGLAAAQDYQIAAEADGYISQAITGLHISGYQALELSLSK